jgi:hypothetical protein
MTGDKGMCCTRYSQKNSGRTRAVANDAPEYSREICPMPKSVSQYALDLYDDALVWDTHSGFMLNPAADLNNVNIWRDADVN